MSNMSFEASDGFESVTNANKPRNIRTPEERQAIADKIHLIPYAPRLGYDLDDSTLEAFVAAIAEQQKHDSLQPNAKPMLPITIETIKKYAYAVFGVDAETGELAIFNAVTYTYPEHDMIEIGGLIVRAPYRKGGEKYSAGSPIWPVKGYLMDVVREHYPDMTMVILANPSSLDINLSIGYEEVLHEELPSVIFDYCDTCPDKVKACDLGKLCCDTALKLSVRDATFKHEYNPPISK